MSREVSIWNALADPKRRQIIALLQGRPRTTGELASHFDVSRFAVMKHLKVLEEAALIAVRREGRTRWNVLNRELLETLRTEFMVDTASQSSSMLEQSLELWPAYAPADGRAQPAQVTVTEQVELSATPTRVFAALTDGIDSWWQARYAQDSRLVLEPFVNGRFFEAFDETGQGILHAVVTYIRRDVELRLRGPLQFVEDGPFAPVPDSTVRIVLTAGDNATGLTLTHYVGGAAGADTLAAVRRQWRAILTRQLKPFTEEGIPFQLNP